MQIMAEQQRGAISSTSLEEHRGWLSLWTADVPGKAKIHVWRLIKNGLAVGSELSKRHIKEGVCCIACNRQESLMHRFWRCPHSIRTWELVSELAGTQFSKPRIQNLNHHELQAWILDWLGHLGDRELALGIMVLYQLWLTRNNAREETRLADPVEVARRSISLVEEWQAAQMHTSGKQAPINEQWLPPEQGWCKANVDGAFSMDQSIGGCGVVLRDHHGGFLSGACRLFAIRIGSGESRAAGMQACIRTGKARWSNQDCPGD
jgi:hypothetical protein